MSRSIMLIPITSNAGLQTVALSLVRVMQHQKISATLMLQPNNKEIVNYLAQSNLNELLEELVGEQEECTKNNEVVIVKGVALSEDAPFAMDLNFKIATALDAAIIFVGSAERLTSEQLLQRLQITTNSYINLYERDLIGLIINKLPKNFTDFAQLIDKYRVFRDIDFKLIANIPYLEELSNKSAGEAADKINKFFDTSWFKPFLTKEYKPKLTPAMFRYHLITKAKSVRKHIILPEGDEPRTVAAANICANHDIAKCILMGEKESIERTVQKIGVKLSDKITILKPDAIREKYIKPLYELRRHKGLTIDKAREQLQDNVMLGTMMLQLGDVDGLVSGAVHTTANTIRPALQIIKTMPDTDIVSSVFFICLPNQVLVYGDCAINPNPAVQQLADIAIQSADSANIFGILPRVAMLSYSTGISGKGPDVEKIREATDIVKNKRPDLLIEGPLQYDAAIVKEVAELKLPNSKVAGRATVLIFPDLNAGNIAAKVAQRSANIVCIGPLLQGMRKPVNDLSRGCLIEDIVFTIAITAVQAE